MNKFAVGIDIETRPNMELVEKTFDPPRQPFVDKDLDITQWKTATAQRRNLKLWEDTRGNRVRKHEEKENERWQKHVEKATLCAERAHVLCISYYQPEFSRVEWGDEKELLQDLWATMCYYQQRDGRIYTASGTQFDIRFCFRRNLCLGLKLDPNVRIFSTNRHGRLDLHRSFVDVSEIFAAGDHRHKIRVDDLAIGMGFDGKEKESGVTGANFWRMVEEHGTEHCEPYAIADARIAYEVGRRMEACGVWPELVT